MRLKQTILSIMVLGVLSLAAYTGNTDKKMANNKGGDTIKIAMVAPLSGNSAMVGKEYQSGALLAAEEINSKGGVTINGKKYSIEMISEDDAGDPKQGATVAQKIIDRKDISAVVGHYNSGIMMVTQPMFANASLSALTVTTNADVTQKAIKSPSGDTTIFQMTAADDRQGPALATYAQKKGYKTIAIIDDATAYGKGIADQVAKKAKELGIQVISRDSATDKTTNFKGLLIKIKALNPDAVMWGGLDDTAAVLTKQARELTITSALLMPDGVCTENYTKLTDRSGEGTVCSLSASPLADMKGGLEFKTRFEKRFTDQKVQGYSPFGYDSVMTIIEAIKKADSADAAKVTAAMKGISVEGLSGTIAYTDRGERKDSVVTIVEAKDGEFVIMDKVSKF